MSTEERNSHPAANGPVHDDVAFDPRDIRSGSVLAFLLYLAITLGVTLAACWGIWTFTASRAREFDTPPPPVRQGMRMAYPPEPRLQGSAAHPTDAQQDLRDSLARDRAALEQTRWVNAQAGTAQIPIEDAMKIIAEKGLPAWAAKPAKEKKP
ncbi:MAG: hypothetical protein ABSF92_14325 [Candidatus Acidiferrales bacterium]|jgi:hypothetical protein